MKPLIARFVREEEGATAIEHGSDVFADRRSHCRRSSNAWLRNFARRSSRQVPMIIWKTS